MEKIAGDLNEMAILVGLLVFIERLLKVVLELSPTAKDLDWKLPRLRQTISQDKSL